MEVSFASSVVILLLVTDPLGNIPLFASALKQVPGSRRRRVMLRECGIAYAVLVLFALAGEPLLGILGISDRSLNIAGGVILFLIAVRLIFRSGEALFGDSPQGEPFIVPLAIPAIAGPTAIATVMLFASKGPGRMTEWIAAISISMVASYAAMRFAETIARAIGERGLMALERLMGLLLTAIAVEMLLRGIEGFVRQLS
jgi:MarC family membrane protein